MAWARVFIVHPTAGSGREAGLLNDVGAGRLLLALTRKMKLIVLDQEGKLISYGLDHEASGRVFTGEIW